MMRLGFFGKLNDEVANYLKSNGVFMRQRKKLVRVPYDSIKTPLESQ
jgi:hypothetical protein